MATVAELFVKISTDTKDAVKGLEKIQSKLDSASKKMGDVGGNMTKKVSAPILGIATAAVFTGAKFDDSMSKVQAISGATGDELALLRDMAKEMGSTTRYSASEAADAMSYLALAGWDTNQILEATPDMLSLASAGAMDLASAADIVSDTMSAFQMDATDAGKAADIFAAASSKSNTDVAGLGEAMKYAGSMASASGMDLAETATILGVFADSGIKGSMAGTTLNGILRDMQANAENGAIAIGETQVAVYNADGSMRDFGDIMSDVTTATQDMTQEQKNMALSSVFGQEALKGVNIAIATGTTRYNELEGAIRTSDGAAQTMSDTMENNTGGAFRELKSQLEGIFIELSEQLAPVINNVIIPALKGFGDWISSVLSWFNNLSPGMQKTIAVVVGLVVAIGPALVIISKLIGFVKTAITVFKAIKIAITAVSVVMGIGVGPILGIIAGIAALIAIGVLLYKNWDKIKAMASNLWASLSTSFTNIKNAVSGKIGEVISVVKEIPGKIIDVMKSLPGQMTNIGKDLLRGLWKGIQSMGSWVKSKVTNLMNKIVPGPIKKLFGIASPSKLFKGYGENLNEGLVIGMEDSSRQVERASERMANTVIDGFNGPSIPNNADSVGAGGFTQNLTINSPRELSPSEIAQKNREMGKTFAMEVGII